jgi:DNA polymerase-3 subunit epsilon
MNFVSVDVETANSDMASVCQIGIAVFKHGKLIDEWVTVIDPNDYFADINVSIHGITKRDVTGAPEFSAVADKVNNYFKGNVVISHGAFDRTSLSKAFAACNVEFQFGSWLDTTRVVKRAWPQFSKKGYGLANVSETIGYKFKHHDALEDAKAAGAILLEAIKLTSISLDDWPKRVNQPIDLNTSSEKRDGNPDGDLSDTAAD